MSDDEILAQIVARERTAIAEEKARRRKEWMLFRYRRHTGPMVFSAAGALLLALIAALLLISGQYAYSIACVAVVVVLARYALAQQRVANLWFEAAFRRPKKDKP